MSISPTRPSGDSGSMRLRVLSGTILAVLVFGTVVCAQSLDDLTPDRLLMQGQREQARGNLAQAIALYNRAIQMESKFAEAYLGRGIAEQMDRIFVEADDFKTREFDQA